MDPNVESDVAAIEALYRQVERACIDGDAALLADVYTDTSLYMPPDKPNLVGKAAIEARYKGVFEERQIEVTYHSRGDRGCRPMGVRPRNLHCEIHTQGRWRDHANLR